MGGGFSGGGGTGDDNDNDEEDERVDAVITDYGDTGGASAEEEDDESAAVAGAAAAAASASGGSGSSGAAGVAGGVTGGGSSGGDSDGESGSGEDSDDDGEEGNCGEADSTSEDSDSDSEESEREHPREREQPEHQDRNQPDIEDPDREPDEDLEGEDEEDEEEEEENQKEAEITVTTDIWDNTEWGMEPVLKQLQHTFGDKLTLSYEPGPVRRFDSPDVRADIWQENAERHGMPTNKSVWETEAPSSTEQSTRAFTAAQEQDEQTARDYLRELRIAAQVDGKNIENRELLVELADEVGLDSEQLQEDMESVEVEETNAVTETPVLDVTIDDFPRTWEGCVEFERALAAFLGHGMQPEPVPQSVSGFVEEHGPVATAEVAAVFDRDQEDLLNELRGSDRIHPREHADGTFWEIASDD